jgi:hypothetical protein
MRLHVELMQRKLVASGDGPDEPDPFFLGYARLPLIGVEQIAKGCGLAFTPVLVWTLFRGHGQTLRSLIASVKDM